MKKTKRENAPLKLSLAHWNINNLYLLLLEGVDEREREIATRRDLGEGERRVLREREKKKEKKRKKETTNIH